MAERDTVSLAATGPSEDGDDQPAALKDAGAVRNTFLQLLSSLAGLVFTGGLTLYLVRALGAPSYGLYALAISIGSLFLFPAGLGLPMAVGRFIADHREEVPEMRAILRLALRVQVPVALVTGAVLFALAAPLADAYHHPHLLWPLRIVGLSVFGQSIFHFLTSMAQSVRRVSITLWMSVVESASETSTAVALVIAGAGAAGAVAGKAIGYTVATVVGLYLMLRLLGGVRRRTTARSKVGLRRMMGYAGAMFVVDVTWSAITSVDVLLIGALLSSAAVGSFGAVVRVMTVLGYLGLAVSGGVAPRLSLGAGGPDTRALEEATRYLIIVQGLVIAPTVVWATPIVHLLLGPGYHGAAAVMRVLSVMYFVGAPASLISVAVTYLGEARRRVAIMVPTLVLGLLSTYILIRAVGLVGAAIGDDLVQIVYVGAHLWLCSRMITLNVRRLALCFVRTVTAAGAMALPLLALGTQHLNVGQWIIGGFAGVAAYAAVLFLTRELTIGEVRVMTGRLWRGSHEASA